MHPKQSWPSAFVDIAIIGSVVALCFVPSVSPMAWSVLGQIALVRFGVAVTKQAFGNASSSGSSPNSDRDPPAPPPVQREPRKRQDTPPADTLRRSVLGYALVPIIVAAATIASSIH